MTAKTPGREDLDGLKRRVEEAGRAIDVARLAIGPQAPLPARPPATRSPKPTNLDLVVGAAAEIWPA